MKKSLLALASLALAGHSSSEMTVTSGIDTLLVANTVFAHFTHALGASEDDCATFLVFVRHRIHNAWVRNPHAPWVAELNELAELFDAMPQVYLRVDDAVVSREAVLVDSPYPQTLAVHAIGSNIRQGARPRRSAWHVPLTSTGRQNLRRVETSFARQSREPHELELVRCIRHFICQTVVDGSSLARTPRRPAATRHSLHG